MAYLVQDIYTRMSKLFSGRTIVPTDSYEATRKSVLELSENYEFPALQRTGPVVSLVPNNPGPYAYSAFENAADAGLEINKFDSFFLYLNGPPIVNQTNAGYPLKYKTIDVLEILMNTVGQPTNWTRHDGSIYFAQTPSQVYYAYLRYQKEHPFPNAGSVIPFPTAGSAGNDPVLLPNSWQDIVEYCTGERLAQDYGLTERAKDFHNIVYGDPKFQATGGTEGAPGLIFARTSQKQRDQTTSTKSMRLMMRPVMR